MGTFCIKLHVIFVILVAVVTIIVIVVIISSVISTIVMTMTHVAIEIAITTTCGTVVISSIAMSTTNDTPSGLFINVRVIQNLFIHDTDTIIIVPTFVR